MRIEHMAFQVEAPAAMAGWYVAHLGFTIKRQQADEPWAHFLADASGGVMIEIYRNPRAAVPDYRAQDPLTVHLAFTCHDVPNERDRLIQAGCSLFEELGGGAGEDHIVMLRDPWGFAIQLCHRAQPMV